MTNPKRRMNVTIEVLDGIALAIVAVAVIHMLIFFVKCSL